MIWIGRFVLFVTLTIILAACGIAQTLPDVGETPVPSVPSRAGQVGYYFDIQEIGLGQDGFVALTNFTDVSAHLGGLFLCQETACFELPDVNVGPGKTVRITTGDGTGLENIVATGATFGELRPSDGEIALFASPDTGDPDGILTYLQWGSTPHELTSVAVEAGQWLETSFAPTSPMAVRLYRVEGTGLWVFEEP